jgi:Tol biopolymer transport system component
VACATAAALALPATAARDDLDLVSRANGPGGAAADGESSSPSLSADGRYAAFASGAANLAADDLDPAGDVFVRDLVAGTTTLASRGPGGFAADAGSGAPAISGDGRVVVFQSVATNLSGEDVDGVQDVFARDLMAGTTTLVSRASSGGAGADGDSMNPAVSADGRFVAFESLADNLAADDDKDALDVFVRDLATGATTLASRATGGAAGDGSSFDPSISGDGRLVAFASAAGNLSSDDDPSVLQNVYLRDLAAGTTALASRAGGPGGAGGDDNSFGPSISADGRVVAFTSDASNLVPGAAGGVYARDLAAARTLLVSRAGGPDGAPAQAASDEPSTSADGRVVAFQSDEDGLSPDDVVLRDVFARDLAAGTTTLLSRAAGPGGPGADGDSFRPSVSGDGRFVAFESVADNLSAIDDDGVVNVFRRDLGVPPPAAAAGPPPGPASPAARARPRCDGRLATLVGTPRRDRLVGTRGADVIVARAGDDVVLGRGGADRICLGAGADRGDGGPGADRILGEAGADRLSGGAGADLLRGGPGRDRLVGGAGRDVAAGGAGRDVCLADRSSAC